MDPIQLNLIILKTLNKKELLDKCKELGIKKYSGKNKDQLIELINSSNGQQPLILSDTDNGENGVTEQNVVVSKVSPLLRLKPLVKWSGGKGDEIKQFEQHFPANYETYIEPFVGGGSVFFHLAPKKAVINDVHKELVDFYRSIAEKKAQEIYQYMENLPNSEETYYKVRDKMLVNSPLDNAMRFYYLRKTCFRGMLRYNKDGKFNIPYGRYNTINYSDLQNKAYEELLSRTEVLNESFEYLFEHYNDANNFMFLDPPYDSEFTDYGYCKFGKEEQKKLASLFKATKIKCLMIIGKTSFIEKLYKDYIVGEYDKKYKFKLYAGRIGDEINTKHLIIKNY